MILHFVLAQFKTKARPADHTGRRGSYRFPLLLATLILAGCSGTRDVRRPESAPDRIARFVEDGGLTRVGLSRFTAIDSTRLTPTEIAVYLNDSGGDAPIREETVTMAYAALTSVAAVGDLPLRIYCRGTELGNLIPNLERTSGIDASRIPLNSTRRRDSQPVAPFARDKQYLVRNLDQPWISDRLLGGRHIAMWPSHGWYYEPSLDRWEWQRARLFQAVEDKLPLAFSLQYLVPMLENAGASVLLPRERDWQIREVVVDNDSIADSADSPSNSQYAEIAYNAPFESASPGFRDPGAALVDGTNPFREGTFRILPPADSAAASVLWVPDIPEAGEYGVYVSYAAAESTGHQCVADSRYSVTHAGGTSHFSVNQCMAFATWVYLGRFKFESGRTANAGSVALTNDNATGNARVTADAVRFGGGMGSVVRGDGVSGKPRYLEGARYYLQYAGMPDSLVYSVWENGDYVDDYRSRGEWVNYLVGAPFGPNADRHAAGLNVPIDVSLAFHTDAGMAQSDTTIGTLLIYSSTGQDGDKTFPDSVSRLANRDLADILQTQIVADMRKLADKEWPRRPLWDRDYSEAVRPNVPSALLELLAHQNFTDMQFALDPRFRFAISRSIYKGIARYLAFQYGEEFVAQPLPVDHFAARLDGREVSLSWEPVADSLEATATPDSYVVYQRVDGGGWDNGTVVQDASFRTTIHAGAIHSFRVRALNRGGISFPSEVLSVGIPGNPKGHVLVVNGFDRVSGPAWFEAGPVAGFPDWLDHGVADGVDLSRTGPQYRFVRRVPWLDDDAPGFGASYGVLDGDMVPGNSFDYPSVHGLAILQAGYSFESVSDEVFEGDEAHGYDLVDLILGEEKLTPWPKGVSPPQFKAFPNSLRKRLADLSDSGVGLFVSGAYLGSELMSDSVEVAFASDILGFRHRTDHAVLTGELNGTVGWMPATFSFSASDANSPYAVEAPDSIIPAEGAETILRFGENNMSAGIGRGGEHPVVAMSIPFESIVDADARAAVMAAVIEFLSGQ